MIKNKVIFEVKKDDKTIQLLCDPDVGLGFLHDALQEMKVFVIQKINEALKNEEVSKEEK